MGDHVVNETRPIYKRWWFWVILLAIIVVIGFTIIMVMAFSVIKGQVSNLAIDIQGIYKEATVYSSAGKNTLFVELRNLDSSQRNYTKTDSRNNKKESAKQRIKFV